MVKDSAYLDKSDVANKNRSCLLYSLPSGGFVYNFFGCGGNLCDGKPKITQIWL
jgi:hypothetical protein